MTSPHPPAVEPPRGRLVIVDAHGHAFRAYHALAPMHAPDGLPTHALFGLAGLLKRLVFEERPDRLAVVFDAPDETRRTFRTALYPAYKATRAERPADLALQIPLLRDLTRAFDLPALEHPDFEADDLIATLVRLAEADGFETTILSSDKDLMQLVSPRTTLWDAMRGKRYTPDAVHEKLGVPPALVADYLALIGDTSDNVPGVHGIGPKGASRLLAEHGSLDGVYAHLALVPPRDRTRLETSRDLAFLSRDLTRLRADVPLGHALDDLALFGLDLAPLLDLAHRLGFRGLARELSSPQVTRLAASPRRPVATESPFIPALIPAVPFAAQAPAEPIASETAPEPEPQGPPAPTPLDPNTFGALRQALRDGSRPALRLADASLHITFPRAHFTLTVAPVTPTKRPGQGDLFAPAPLGLADLTRALVEHLGPSAHDLPLTLPDRTLPALAHFAELLPRAGR
jgi:DNA polymerase-1